MRLGLPVGWFVYLAVPLGFLPGRLAPVGGCFDRTRSPGCKGQAGVAVAEDFRVFLARIGQAQPLGGSGEDGGLGPGRSRRVTAMSTADPPSSEPRRRRQDVQPADPHLEETVDHALLAELDKIENLTAAQKLERLAESDIVRHLALQGFNPTSDDWKELAGALIEYGYSVFMGWTVTGVVRNIAARANGGQGVFGLGRIPEGLQLPPERAHDLVMDLLEVSIEKFRTHTLAKNRWSPTGGASLKTFFVGRCLMSLPDVFEHWDRRQIRPYGLHRDDLPDEDGRFGKNPAAHAVATATIDYIFDGGPHTSIEVRAMFELQQLEWSLEEIAEALSDAGYPNTVASVRTKMSRARRDARRRLTDDAEA